MNASGKLCSLSVSQQIWCGPTALSAITGRSYAESVRHIEQVRGKPFKDYAYTREVKAVLTELGYVIRHVHLRGVIKHLPTLSQMTQRRTGLECQQFILAVVTGHFVAIQGDEICDSAYTGGKPMKIASLPKGNKWKRVQEYLVIEEVPA